MLLYHPLYDAHHCAYRLLTIYKDSKGTNLYWEQLKIFDFYFLFPHLMTDIKLPQELKSRRPLLRGIAAPYENLPSPQQLIFKLGEIQEQTIRSLMAKGIIDKNAFAQGKIKIFESMLDNKIFQLMEEDPIRQNDWYHFITKELSLIPVFGINGLKDRTGLMEYRYDTV